MHKNAAEDDIQIMATPPRLIVPGRIVHLTIRAVSRQHRFVPTKKVTQSIEYIVMYCAKKYGISLHEMQWMSNHAHIVLTDEKGLLPSFVGQMNSLISRQLNAIRGKEGTNIEKGYVDQEIIGEEAVLRLCAYTLANPCAAGLVATVKAWKGVSSYKREYGKKFVVRRPNFGLWRNSPKPSDKTNNKPSVLPLEVEGVLIRPRVMLEKTDKEVRDEIRRRTKLRELKAHEDRHRAQRGVIGWRKVVKMRHDSSARSFEELHQPIPQLATSCLQDKVHHLERIAKFREQYKEQLDIYTEFCPTQAVFPTGTWKMASIYNAYYDPGPPSQE